MRAEDRPAHTAALVGTLAAWAESHRELSAVIRLPFDALEEQVRPAMNLGSFF